MEHSGVTFIHRETVKQLYNLLEDIIVTATLNETGDGLSPAAVDEYLHHWGTEAENIKPHLERALE